MKDEDIWYRRFAEALLFSEGIYTNMREVVSKKTKEKLKRFIEEVKPIKKLQPIVIEKIELNEISN